MYSFIFLNVEASKVMVMEAHVRTNVKKLLGLIKHGLAGNVGSRVSFSQQCYGDFG
jgi:linoleate 10R-lipoxygenase